MPEDSKVDDSGIEALIRVPEPHPAKEIFEKYGISHEQIARRILKTPEEVKKILDGKVVPVKWVEERIQNLMKDVGFGLVKEKSD